MYWCVFAFRLFLFFSFSQISPNQIDREWLTLHLVAFEFVIAYMIWWDGRLRWLHLVPRQSVFWETRCPQSVSTKWYAWSCHACLPFSAELRFFFPSGIYLTESHCTKSPIHGGWKRRQLFPRFRLLRLCRSRQSLSPPYTVCCALD